MKTNGFTGSEQGLENRYIHLGARTYDPTMGRFLSVDPMFEAYSNLTPYHYCANSPLTNVDPSGMTIITMMEVDDDGVCWLVTDGITLWMILAHEIGHIFDSKNCTGRMSTKEVEDSADRPMIDIWNNVNKPKIFVRRVR